MFFKVPVDRIILLLLFFLTVSKVSLRSLITRFPKDHVADLMDHYIEINKEVYVGENCLG